MSSYNWLSSECFHDGEWDQLVALSNDGTLFHTRRFLSYHSAGKFVDGSLVVTKRGNLHGVFPAAERIRLGADGATSERWLVSHPGASYGGIILQKIPDYDEAFEIGKLLQEHARSSGFKGIEITPPPTPYCDLENDVWAFAMLQLGFTYRKREYTQVVPLHVDDVQDAYDNKTKGALRRAQALGVTVREVELSDANWDIFYPMLVENRKKHNVTPAHSREDLSTLSRLCPDAVKLYFAFDSEGVVVAGTLIFIANPRLHLTFYIAHERSRAELKAVVPLNHFSIEQAKLSGARWLDFGISTVNGVPGDGLIRFKENFGAIGRWRDVYYCELS